MLKLDYKREKWIIKFADFGLSKFMKSAESTTTFVGTPLYEGSNARFYFSLAHIVAPELWAPLYGKIPETYSKTVDIWSLGLVFFQILFLLNFQGLGAFLKRVGLLDPDIVLRKTRIPNLVPVEIRALMVERFQLQEATSTNTTNSTNTNGHTSSGPSSACSVLGGVHGEVMALLGVMLQAEDKRSSAASILASYTPQSWKDEYKSSSMFAIEIMESDLRFFGLYLPISLRYYDYFLLRLFSA